VVHLPAFSTKQNAQPPITVPDPASCQIPKSNPQDGPFITNTPVTMARPGDSQHLASATLADAMSHLQPFDQNTLTNGLQTFFDRTS
jgi:hypothetical protein